MPGSRLRDQLNESEVLIQTPLLVLVGTVPLQLNVLLTHLQRPGMVQYISSCPTPLPVCICGEPKRGCLSTLSQPLYPKWQINAHCLQSIMPETQMRNSRLQHVACVGRAEESLDGCGYLCLRKWACLLTALERAADWPIWLAWPLSTRHAR